MLILVLMLAFSLGLIFSLDLSLVPSLIHILSLFSPLPLDDRLDPLASSFRSESKNPTKCRRPARSRPIKMPRHPHLSHALAVLIKPALAPTEPPASHIRVARLFIATDVAPVGVEPAPEALQVAGQRMQTKGKKGRELTPMHFLYLSSQDLQSAAVRDMPAVVVVSPVECREAALVVPAVSVAVVGEAREMARPVLRRVGSFMVILVEEGWFLVFEKVLRK
jgi:hypothetical protein